MKKLLIGLAAMPFLAGIAMAGQPKLLSDAQMDKVTAGQSLEIEFGIGLAAIEVNFGPVLLNVEISAPGEAVESSAASALGGLVCNTPGGCVWFSS
jgi:hypothetical protein